MPFWYIFDLLLSNMSSLKWGFFYLGSVQNGFREILDSTTHVVCIITNYVNEKAVRSIP